MRRLGVPLLLLAMTVGVFWRLALTSQYTYLDSPDLANQVAPWLQVQAYAWHHGDFPLLWDPYVAGGQSLIGQAQPATAFPMSWLLFLLPLHRGFISQGVLHRYMVLVHYFAALACYALCRDLGRSRVASILGASAYAFGGYVASTWWPQQLQMVIFAPLALMFTLRAMRGERPARNTFFSGFFLGMMWLAGHHQVPIFTALGIAGLWLFHVANGKSPAIRIDRAKLFAALIAAMIAAGALQLFPAYSYGHDSVRWVNASHAVGWNQWVPFSVHDEFSQTPSVILGPVLNGFFRHANPFVGFTVVLLAIAAVVLAWNNAAVKLLAFLSLGGLIFSLGGAGFFEGLIYAIVPLVEKARTPAVAVFVFHLGICPLAAFGVDKIVEDPRSLRVRNFAVVSAAAAALLFLLTVHIEVDQAKVDWHLYTVPVTALAAVLIAALLVAMRSGSADPRKAAVWLVLLVLLEIGNFNGMGMKNRDLGWTFWPSWERDRDVAAFLKNQNGLFRVDPKFDDVQYSFGDAFSLETFSGNTASLMDQFVQVNGEAATRRLLGVKYYLAKTQASPDQHEVFSGASGLKVFEVPGAMPRAWAVHEASKVERSNIGAALFKLDLEHATIMLHDAPALESCSGDRVNVDVHKAQFTSIDAQMQCKGMVILGDSYSKDWLATVDGKPAPIFAAYTFLRGVVVDRGEHRIEFRYRPQSVYWGAALTFGSMALALVLAVRRTGQ